MKRMGVVLALGAACLIAASTLFWRGGGVEEGAGARGRSADVDPSALAEPPAIDLRPRADSRSEPQLRDASGRRAANATKGSSAEGRLRVVVTTRGGEPVRDVPVLLRKAALLGHAEWLRATDRDGIVVHDVPGGAYDWMVNAERFSKPAWTSARGEVSLAKGVPAELRVVLEPLSETLIVSVVDDRGVPIPGARVRAAQAEALSDAAGLAAFLLTAGGSTTVRTELPAGGDHVLEHGEHEKEVDLGRERFVTVTATRCAWLEVSIAVTPGFGDQALPDRLSLWCVQRGSWRSATAHGGRATLRLPAGQWRVRVQGDAASPWFAIDEPSVRLPPGGNASVTVAVAAGVELTGRAVDTRGAALPGARVRVSRTESTGTQPRATWATAAADGSFRLRGLPPGPCRIEAELLDDELRVAARAAPVDAVVPAAGVQIVLRE